MRFGQAVLEIAGIGILVYFLSTIRPEDLKVMGQASVVPMLGVFACLGCNIALKAVRWRYMTTRLAAVSMPMTLSVTSVVAGVSSGAILPGRLEFAKPIIAQQRIGADLGKMTFAMLFERAWDLLALLATFMIGLMLLVWGKIGALLLIPLIVAVPAAIRWASSPASSLLAKVGGRRRRVSRALNALRYGIGCVGSPRPILVIWSLSFGATMFEVLRLSLVFQSLGIPVDIATVALGLTSSILAGLITLIPGGIGVVEWVQTRIIAGNASFSESIAGPVLLDRLISYYLLVLCGSVITFLYGVASPKNAVKDDVVDQGCLGDKLRVEQQRGGS